MKKTLISAFFILTALFSFSICAFGAETLTIGEVTMSEQTIDGEEIIFFTASYSASSAPKHISVVFSSESIGEISEENKDKVLYIDQIDAPSKNIITFPVLKSKIAEFISDGKDSHTFYLKLGADNINKTAEATVDYKSYLLGDIDFSGNVDIDDAILLFQNSMMPEDYPINYSGNMDYTKDGFIDIDDAILLFQYSMMPEDYPIM